MSRSISINLPVPGARVAWLTAGLLVGLIGAVVAGPLLSTRPTLATDPATTAAEHTISVSGTGRIVLTPDTADVRLGVTSTAKTVKVARANAAVAMTAVIASLRKIGVAEADIQTTTLSLQPTYNYASGTNPPQLTGYNLTNAIAVTVRDLDKLGDAIDGALAAGATSLDGVTFRVANQAAAEAQARQAAMAEAAAKAKTLAEAAHVSITGVASISETVAPVPYPIMYSAAAGVSKDVATPVMTGTTEVTVTVAVAYLIG
ncbi:MAG TPA: SIMPL domain-containing protein [Candidatus Limnocylindrales bacterium]|nr:SIMPL domain-containing protein [Candidatus Limnocylindrales bacterium]